jgi:hypothetical protein
MSFVLFLAAAVVLLVVPIKVAATYVHAGRTGIGSCVFAVLAVSALQTAVQAVISTAVLAYLVTFAIAPLIFMVILDTNYKKGLGIALLQLVLLSILALVFIAVLPGSVTVRS